MIYDEISDYAKDIFERISKSYHITLVEWNHEKREQNKLSRCALLAKQKGINLLEDTNCQKNYKVAQLHEKVRNQRRVFNE